MFCLRWRLGEAGRLGRTGDVQPEIRRIHMLANNFVTPSMGAILQIFPALRVQGEARPERLMLRQFAQGSVGSRYVRTDIRTIASGR